MKSVLKFFFFLLPLLPLMSCDVDDDDDVHSSNLKFYVFDECVLDVNDYVVLYDRNDVDNFINNYIAQYERDYDEEFDVASSTLIKQLLYYDSMFFHHNGIVLRGVETTAHIHYKVDNVWVSSDDDVLNIDISQLIDGDRKYCSTILVECSRSELNNDIVWNISSSYED